MSSKLKGSKSMICHLAWFFVFLGLSFPETLVKSIAFGIPFEMFQFSMLNISNLTTSGKFLCCKSTVKIPSAERWKLCPHPDGKLSRNSPTSQSTWVWKIHFCALGACICTWSPKLWQGINAHNPLIYTQILWYVEGCLRRHIRKSCVSSLVAQPLSWL